MVIDIILKSYILVKNFLGGSVVKNLPANVGMLVQSLVQEDPLEKEMAIHFGILPWESHRQSLVGYSP